MAFTYEKKDPKGSASRWMAKVKIGGEYEVVSLRLKVGGTTKLAEQRARTLQAECDMGQLSMPTMEWLGEKTTATLQAKVAQARLDVKSGEVGSWEAAWKGYVKAHEAKDTKTPIPGTARTVERTKKVRMEAVRKMGRWLIDNKVPFMKRPFTNILIDYIEARKRLGLKPNTLWAGDYTYGVLWGDWMHRRGLCEKPERDRIREVIPPKGTPIVVLPEAVQDADTIRFFRDHKDHVVYREGEGADLRGKRGVNWRATRRYKGAWSLMLLIRGVGCRPSEATALTWRTVKNDLSTITFLSTKNDIVREVPILFEWVRRGLAELMEEHGGEGAVCRSTEGKAWSEDSGPSYCWREILSDHGMPAYTLKKSQKLYIAQTIKMGFPPHVVANWTGHTLTIQERHYCESRSYLPSRDKDAYGEFGMLSEWGKEVRAHLGSFANLLPQGGRRE